MRLKRSQVVAFFARLTPCLIGMEACGCAHFWARKLMQCGHTVKLIAPQFVKPYVKTNKNDIADAEAICEAVGRPNMRFVPIKNAEQQALLSLHRARQGFVVERTAQVNQIRGLMAELELVMPAGIRCIERKLPEFLEDTENGLSGVSRENGSQESGSTGPSVHERIQDGGSTTGAECWLLGSQPKARNAGVVGRGCDQSAGLHFGPVREFLSIPKPGDTKYRPIDQVNVGYTPRPQQARALEPEKGLESLPALSFSGVRSGSQLEASL
jgi:hypothetical protein